MHNTLLAAQALYLMSSLPVCGITGPTGSSWYSESRQCMTYAHTIAQTFISRHGL